ncbi:MAG: hypothetical protein FJX72_19815, partial [Armatimonadetes bacterium]|nr:hypothetical protein [Armatimonadota bacterium]
MDAPDGVRVVLGRPGSGKTTVLWTAVEAHPGESVLYLTWSDQLRTLSAERFEAYAPANTDVRAKTFYDLLGEIAGRDVEVRPHAALVADFGAAIHKITDKDLGPWKGRTEAMFAEMRAHLVGAATGAATSAPHTKDPSPWRLSEDAYHRARDPHIGHAAARGVLKAYRVLARNGLCERLFPEMVAAATAVKRLQSGTIPDGYEAFDRVVVDEVQDLTACEVAALLEYCRALAIRQGRAPRLLIAGDSGQTVRPTGFDWGTLNGLISERIADPVRYDLRRSLRCPEPIARVIARADALYKDLERELHPDKQLQYIDHGPDEDEQVGAAPFGRPTLVYLTIKDQEEAELLLDALGSRDDLQDQVMVVAAAGAHPTWLASRHRDLVLLPAAAKGLECETVIVIEPAPILEHVQVRPDLDPDERLEDRQRRMAVDRLRVAASRATQTLVFADVAPDATTTARSMDLMPEAQPMDVPELLALLTDAEMPTVERVDARISEASRLFGEMPGRAWLRARQALQLLRGDSASAHDEDSALSARACSTVLRFAAALLLGGPPEGVGRNELIRGAREALQTPAFRDGDDAFEALGAWSLDQSKPPFALLSAAQGYLPLSQSAWFRDALASRRQMLR